jgi:hypothetical protein
VATVHHSLLAFCAEIHLHRNQFFLATVWDRCHKERKGDHPLMLLTLTYKQPPATDLGFLLHKNPARAQQVEVSTGTAHVFYPEATDQRCTVALLLEVDPVGLVRTARAGGPRARRSRSTSTTGPTPPPACWPWRWARCSPAPAGA